MIMAGWTIGNEYKTLCDADRISTDPRIVSAVGVLSVIATGLDFDVDTIANSLADVSQEHDVDPDAIQHALTKHVN